MILILGRPEKCLNTRRACMTEGQDFNLMSKSIWKLDVESKASEKVGREVDC